MNGRNRVLAAYFRTHRFYGYHDNHLHQPKLLYSRDEFIMVVRGSELGSASDAFDVFFVVDDI